MEFINKSLKVHLKFKILMLATITYFTACDGDNYQELSGNYILRDEGANNKSILSHEKGSSNIYSKILDYEYNSDFILAKQQPIYKEHIAMIGYELRASNQKKYPTNSLHEQQESEVEADSMLKHNPHLRSIFNNKVNYWIIAHKNKEIYGPLTRLEYKKMRIKLGVPNGLGLEGE